MKSFTTAIPEPLDCCECVVDECCGCICHDMDPRRDQPMTATEVVAGMDQWGKGFNERMDRLAEPILAPMLERAQLIIEGMG